MSKTYSEKLKDPRWQKKRLEILNRDKWTCQRCFDTESTLHVHHIKYSGEPWEVEERYLLTLCDECHEHEHGSLEKEGKFLIEELASKGFLSNDFNSLAIDIHECKKMPIHAEVVTSVLGWVFTNPAVFQQLVDDYFIFLDWRREQREKQENNVLQN